MINIAGYRVMSLLQSTHKFRSYRAIRTSDQLPVILKCPATSWPCSDDIRRFRYEYEILGQKQIPGTVKILGLAKHDQHPVLVCEDVGGIPCSELLCAGTRPDEPETLPNLDSGEFLALAINIARALAAVHQHGIIHKNITLDNLIVHRETGDACITEFSSATLLSRGTSEAISPTLLDYSLSYISPEQTGRMNRDLDYRTDLYSLGISFYHLVTGRLPFISDDPMELIHCHIARVPQVPSNLDPKIPEPISDIIMKLLAKTAEDRYQSAYGLMRDLQRCRDQLTHNAIVGQFVLARDDLSSRLQLSQKLYGREHEVAQLLQSFERMTQTGRTALVLVAGYSGTGKTSLVREVHKPIVAQRGYFISGKYDLLHRDIPYSALIAALRDFVRQVLTERDSVVAEWKQRLGAALSPHGQVIVDVIPDLELIIGPQPPVPTLGPAESANRFDRIFQDFIRVLARPEHPLTIFLDDLQWADSASLRLIQLLAASGAESYLLLLGAYRDNEVTQSHPLMRVLHNIHETRGTSAIISLSPLQRSHVSAFLSDSLRSEKRRVTPLAAILMEKTLGNPFFLRQMLTSFDNKGLLALNLQSGHWEWDWQALKNAHITDNVLELMTEKLHALPSESQEVLQLAACIGNRFSLTTLALVCERSAQDTLSRLWEPLRLGLLLPIGNAAWLIGNSSQGSEFDRIIQARDLDDIDHVYEYKFLHDQVQKAAYELISAPKKQQVHLKIGRLLNAHHDEETKRAALFDIVNHLNLGCELLASQHERIELARMNLDAALKAKNATAYQTALAYTKAGMQLLPGDDAWKICHQLAFFLHIERAECEFLCGQFRAAESRFQGLLNWVEDDVQRSHIRSKQLTILISENRMEEALLLGREALHALGIEFFTDPTEEQWAAQDARFAALRGNRTIASLIDGPRINNPRMEAAVDILLSLSPPSYQTRPKRLYGFINVITMVLNIGLEYGYPESIGYAYATYGFCITNMDRYNEAYEYGKLGMALNRSMNNLAMQGRVTTFFTCFTQYWREHFYRCEHYWNSAYSELEEAGDYVHANFMVITRTAMRIAQGVELSELYQEIQKDLEWIQPMGYELCYRIARMDHQLIANLIGRTKHRLSLDGDSFSEREYLDWMTEQNCNPMGLGYYYAAKSMIYYLYRQPRRAMAAGEEYLRHEPGVSGMVVIAENGFYYSLSILAAYDKMSADDRAVSWAKLDKLVARLKIWSDNCPENFLHRYLLVAAEIARVEGRAYEAMALYDQAIASARENQFVQVVALANELAARFYHSRGRIQMARAYITVARNAYLQWGAKSKVAQLREECYRWFRTGAKTQAAVDEKAVQPMAERLDLMALINASRELSGEIMLETLLDKLMTQILHNTGAERGYLLLVQDGNLRVAINGVVKDDAIKTMQPLPSTALEPILCRAVVDYTYQTGESVAIDDAEKEAFLAGEHYVQANRVKSLLCMPIRRKDEIKALLYLESTSTAGIFTNDQAEFLKLISVQAGISLENAILCRDLTNFNNHLEDLVEKRTTELKSTQQELLTQARQAGMAEIATETVHNLGNILNSIVISLSIIKKLIARQPHKGLLRANGLFLANLDNIKDFLTNDSRGSKLIAYYFEIEKTLNNIHDQLFQELNLINNHISLAKGVVSIQQSYTESFTHEECLNLSELVETVFTLEEKSLARNDISIEKTFCAADPVMVNKTKVMHILMNLCKNAAEAMKDAETKLLSVEIKQVGKQVLLSISDSGCGIPPAVRDRVFQYGFTTKADGHGFGLHSCVNYMREMRGDISVMSEGVGRGATFVLAFPAITPAAE